MPRTIDHTQSFRTIAIAALAELLEADADMLLKTCTSTATDDQKRLSWENAAATAKAYACVSCSSDQSRHAFLAAEIGYAARNRGESQQAHLQDIEKALYRCL